MKFKFLSIFVILSTFFCVGCSNSSNSEDKERIAQLEAQIQELKSTSNNSSQNNAYKNNSIENTSTYNSPREKDRGDYVGSVYQITDEYGQKITIYLNADKVAIFETSNGKKGEGTWYVSHGLPEVFIDYLIAPVVIFPDRKDDLTSFYITDNYIYEYIQDVKTQEKKHRLPVRKIK